MKSNQYVVEEGTGRIFHIKRGGRSWKCGELLGSRGNQIGMPDEHWDRALKGESNFYGLNQLRIVGFDVPVKKYLTGVNGRLFANVMNNGEYKRSF